MTIEQPEQQQPKEQPSFIAYEEDLNCLFDYFEAALRGEESKAALKRLWIQVIGIIRSHPHPTPATLQINPNSETYTLAQIVEINENIRKQRAEAARQAREELIDAINTMGASDDCPYGPCRRVKDTFHDPWGCVKCIAESLRQQHGEQVQGGGSG